MTRLLASENGCCWRLVALPELWLPPTTASISDVVEPFAMEGRAKPELKSR